MPSRLLHPNRWLVVLAALGATFLQGCSCEEERPHTPFQVATALPTDPLVPEESSSAAPVGPDVRRIETVAGRPKTWSAFEMELHAPAGTGFVSGIELPDTAGESAVFAWTLPRKGSALGGKSGLWQFDQKGKPQRRLLEVPTHLPSGKDCTHAIELLDSGPRSFSSRLWASCSSRLLPGTATGSLIVIDPWAEAPERLSFRLREPAPGEEVHLNPRSDDVDQDGKDDFSLEVQLKAPSGEMESLTFRWVGRASGLSHVSATPGEELSRRAGRLAIAAVRKKERARAVAQIDALRRLLFASCAESKTEKLTDGSGIGLRCQQLGVITERLTGAAIDAELGMKHPWKAIGELERRGYYFGASSEKATKEWGKKIRSAVTTVTAREVSSARLTLGMELPYPIRSPLRIDSSGEVHSLTASGRVTSPFAKEEEGPTAPLPPPPLKPAQSDPTGDARPAIPQRGVGAVSQTPSPWPLRPTGSRGEMLSAAVPSCERSEVQLAFSSENSGVLPSRPLEFLAPRPGGCRSLMGKPISAEVINWDGGRLLAVVGGQPVVSAGHLTAPPQPIAWGTSLGIAVWTPEAFFLLVGDGTNGAHHCVAAEGLKKVACVRGQEVVLFEWEGP